MEARSRVGAILVLFATVAGLAGCVESLPTSALPTKTEEPRKLLTKDEQTAAIGELTRVKDTQRAEALKEIQKSK